MDIATIWKLINLGIEIDTGRMLLTIKLGPLTIKDISIKSVKALSSQPGTIEEVLSKHFIQRDVMHADYRREHVQDCIDSLRELQLLNETQAKAFAATGKSEDKLFKTMLDAWANECDKTASALETAIEDERNPPDTGMDTSAREAIPEALGALRKSTYPTVEMLIQLLPEGNLVRNQAARVLAEGKTILIRHFAVPVADLVLPDLELQQGLAPPVE